MVENDDQIPNSTSNVLPTELHLTFFVKPFHSFFDIKIWSQELFYSFLLSVFPFYTN